jgi:hypothetical protein
MFLKTEPKQTCICCGQDIPKTKAPELEPMPVNEVRAYIEYATYDRQRLITIFGGVGRNVPYLEGHPLTSDEIATQLFGVNPFVNKEVLVRDINTFFMNMGWRLDDQQRWITRN